MEKSDIAAELFLSGYNCAQSVFATFSEDYGVSKETALKIACGLGGGVRCGEVCGAATGAVLVIGLKAGHYLPGDLESREFSKTETIDFMNRFRDRNKAVVCREILGVDLSKLEPMELLQKKSLFNSVCIDMVKSAVELLEDMGY